MRKLSKQELRDTQLGLLDEIMGFCKAKNIRCMLAYGTLLGAVRHKGFIPWDDDLDVMMLRPDYEKFTRLFVDNERYGLKTTKNDSAYNYSFGRLYDKRTFNLIDKGQKKIYGVCIDVYPLDGAPDSMDDFQTQVRDLKKVTQKRNIICKFVAVFNSMHLFFLSNALLKSLPAIMKKREDIIRRHGSDSKMYCSCMSSSGTVRHLKSNLEATTTLFFEGKEYDVPCGYDAFLKEQYGNYMQLPPEEQRVPYHLGNYYWKDDE